MVLNRFCLQVSWPEVASTMPPPRHATAAALPKLAPALLARFEDQRVTILERFTVALGGLHSQDNSAKLGRRSLSSGMQVDPTANQRVYSGARPERPAARAISV